MSKGTEVLRRVQPCLRRLIPPPIEGALGKAIARP